MLTRLASANLKPGHILAEDDMGRLLRASDLAGLAAHWGSRLTGRRLVLLLARNDVPHLSAYAGLHAAGHVIVLLPGSIAVGALNALIDRYRPEAVLRADSEGRPQLHELSSQIGGLHPDLSVCLATSGSTGSPKLVRFSDDRLMANASAICEYLQIGWQDVAMAHLPFEYSFGLSVVHSHVLAGAKLLISEHTVMQKPFWQRLREATSLPGVPFHYEMLLRMRLERAELPRLKVLTQAGGHLPQPMVEKVHAIARTRGWKFHIMYGQTEAGPRISWLPHDEIPEWPGCVGRAIPGVNLSLVDGELVVKSPSVAMGHAESRTDLSRGDDLGGRLVTGDMAEAVAENVYRITGRKSRFLKVQGNRIGLQDVENRLAIAGFEVHCTGTEDNLRICIETGEAEDARRAAINFFSFPARSINVVRLPAIPRHANGKVDYPALLRMAMEDPI
jgi:long-chain acyl-CoA synthetase